MKSEFVFTILKFLIVPGVESQVEIMLLCKFMHILLQLIVARNKGLPGMGTLMLRGNIELVPPAWLQD